MMSNVFQKVHENNTAVFAIKVKSLTHNPFGNPKWFPFLSRLIFVDNSPMAIRTNISLAFVSTTRLSKVSIRYIPKNSVHWPTAK